MNSNVILSVIALLFLLLSVAIIFFIPIPIIIGIILWKRNPPGSGYRRVGKAAVFSSSFLLLLNIIVYAAAFMMFSNQTPLEERINSQLNTQLDELRAFGEGSTCQEACENVCAVSASTVVDVSEQSRNQDYTECECKCDNGRTTRGILS